jgi:hypothetical protein
VWLPGGREVDLRARAQFWSILSALADHGGAASKELLAVAVWGARDYHPLRDDKRMQVAMRKLRLLLEDDASTPRRLVTTTDGYAFGAAEPMHRIAIERGGAPQPSGSAVAGSP